MISDFYPFFLAGKRVESAEKLEVFDKYSGKRVTTVSRATPKHLDEAIAAAHQTRRTMKALAPWKRAEILDHCVQRFEERSEELAKALALEAGKPIRDARGEVLRLIDTFKIASGEALRDRGSYESLAISPRADGYEAIVKHVPVGVCGFITPFNFPLNLVAHKVAPAIAAGCPFVLKPASATPVGALIVGEVLAETGLPEGAFSILPMKSSDASALIKDERIALLSFTGSHDTGWALKACAGKKRVSLELGGNAGCIVDCDADLDTVADRVTFGAFYQSGQSCISVQRLYVHEAIYDTLKEKLISRAKALVVGNPMLESTNLGPLISESDAVRMDEWTHEAVAKGAKLLCGGRREGVCFEATWLENVPEDAQVKCSEIFGPIAVMEPFDDFKDAVKRVNNSRYGLQAGIFSKNIHHIFYGWDELEVGGVVANDIPSMRVDSMPYGGVKDSGNAREGVRFAMEEMSEKRLLVLHHAGKIE